MKAFSPPPKWPAEAALALLKDELVAALDLRPPLDWSRTKSQAFDRREGGRPFALIVGGTKLGECLVDLAGQTVIVLAQQYCPQPGPDDLELYFAPLDEQQNSSSLQSASCPELHPGRQQLVHVGSARALRKLLSWYLQKTEPATTAAPSPESNVPDSKTPSMPLNTILYGPPGTGKTYATIDEAMAILDPQFLADRPEVAGADIATRAERRQQLKKRFDELVKAGQVRFVTFHQSFSYEDFVEGLRAVKGEDGGLRYEVVDGVFKAMCDSASARVTKLAEAPQAVSLEGRRIWKMSLGNIQIGDEADIYDECMKKGIALLGWGGGIDFTGCKTQKDLLDRFAANGKPRNSGDYEVTAVTHFVLKMKPRDLIVVTEGNYKFRAIGEVTGDYKHLADEEDFDQCREVRWLCRYTPSQPYERLMNKQFMMKTLYQLHPGSIDLQKLKHLLEEDPTPAGKAAPGETPHVLIIDEINRGNISRIFGELITLVEPSKRAGEEEELSVTLPYSKQPFSVPKNVYLLGTMNTADRSLAGLDIALRRRFVFKEMPPRPELLDAVEVEGVNVGELLRRMNQRIEVLLDREHRLGHAYFMPLAKPGGNTLPALADIFRRQVLPLLEEYFFEDWERIGWVLNDPGKSNPAQRFVQRPPGGLDDLFTSETVGRLQDRRWTLNEAAFKDIGSYRQIIRADA